VHQVHRERAIAGAWREELLADSRPPTLEAAAARTANHHVVALRPLRRRITAVEEIRNADI
jgi:hypothetical protein